MEIGFALCGSFCTFHQVFPVIEQLAGAHRVTPIFSFAAASIDSRFGLAAEQFRFFDIAYSPTLHIAKRHGFYTFCLHNRCKAHKKE